MEFKDFSRLLGDFPALFKADLIFKDFSNKPSKFKYFSSLCGPWLIEATDTEKIQVVCILCQGEPTVKYFVPTFQAVCR